MKIISLYERNNEIIEFINRSKINLPGELYEQLFDFMTKICDYEEEEKKIFPHIIIGNNIEKEEFIKIFPVDIIHLSRESNYLYFFKRIKPLLPFCNNGWRVYVDIINGNLNFGIMRNFSGIEGLTVDDLLKNSKENAEMIYKDYGISCILLNPVNRNTLEIIGMDGESIFISFSLNKGEDSDERQKILFLDDLLMLNPDIKIRRSMKKIIDLFSQKLHGAICLVVKDDYTLPDEGLKDGIFFEEPIDMAGIADELLNKDVVYTPDYIRQLNEKYYAITGLFIEMLNFDGITVVDTKGRIRGYNIFISSHSKEKIITGGARKRAAYTLIESKNSGYIGVYFQSQDGNYFYERIKL